jgi:hypothetical protein
LLVAPLVESGGASSLRIVQPFVIGIYAHLFLMHLLANGKRLRDRADT